MAVRHTSRQWAGLVASVGLLCVSRLAVAVPQSPPADSSELQRAIREIEALRSRLDALESRHQADMQTMERRHDAELTALRNSQGDRWLSQERAAEIREVVREVMADASARGQLQSNDVRAQLENGSFAFRSEDGKFLLNIGGQIQARFAYNYQGPENQAPSEPGEFSLYGFGLRRVQLVFRGYALDPSWTYRIQMNFSQNNPTYQGPNQIQQTVNGAVLDNAFIRKDLGDGFGITVGQWRSMYNYEEVLSSRHQQFVERTMVSQYFTTKFIQGIQLDYSNNFWRTWLNYNDGGGNRNTGIAGVNQVTEWAVAGRAQYKFVGEWEDLHRFYAPRGTPLGVMAGAAFNWQRGQDGPNNSFDGDFIGNSPGMNFSWTADTQLRFDGFSATAAIYGNDFYARPDGEASLKSFGTVIQGGYFVTKDVELTARWEYLNVSGGTDTTYSNPSASNAQNFSIYTAGLNWYVGGEWVKINMDAGLTVGGIMFSNGIYNQSVNSGDFRADTQAGASGQFVARVQLVLMF
ncbi:MAG: hypothetical protein FJ256_02785 [Phycisphaerae bacterium]|nr:hypothetical protein [Phycisphaerae bacterium]